LQQLALADVRDGFPWLPETSLDALLPSALGLYRLGAVSIGKGCYPGQEIVARLHYRSGHKQHLYRLGGVAGMRSGERIEANDQAAGLLLNLAGDEALAVLRDERLPSATTARILQQYPA
jgi:folate-binding protein YgfZ